MYSSLRKVKFVLDEFFRPFFLFLNNLGFKPIHLTLLSFLFGLLGAFYFNSNRVYGIVLLFFWFLFDVGDGMLARATKTESKFGVWIDFFVDRIILVLILYRYYEFTHAVLPVAAGLFLVLVLTLGEILRK